MRHPSGLTASDACRFTRNRKALESTSYSKENNMRFHLNRNHPRIGSIMTASAMIAVSIGLTVQGEERQIVNEPGGIGVDQHLENVVASASSALILFDDDRSGKTLTRVRAIDAFGEMPKTSTPIEELLEPLHGFRRTPQVVMSRDGDALLSWSSEEDPYHGQHKMAWVDAMTGLPRPGAHDVGLHQAVHISDARDLLVLHSDGPRLYARFMDESFSEFGDTAMLVDESDMEFPMGFEKVDVAFLPDGSFLLSWVGAEPPYFEAVRSRYFDAAGNPTGLINHHSVDQELSLTDCRLVRTQNNDFVVMWNEHDSTYGQIIDGQGHPVGPSVLMWQKEDGGIKVPEDIALNSNGDLILISENGMTVVDSNSLAQQSTRQWDTGTGGGAVIWLSSVESVLEIREVLDDARDQDIIGRLHDVQGQSADLGRMADDVDGAYQTAPWCSGNSSGSKVITWLDKRSSAVGMIGYKIFDPLGDAVGPDRFLDIGERMHFEPQVSMNETGAFVICWKEIDFGGPGQTQSLRYQRFNAQGQPVGSIMNIFTEAGFLEPIITRSGDVKYRRNVLLLDNGDLFVAWSMSIVTGGTIGNPIYGRKEIYTKSFDASNQVHPTSINAVPGGNIQGMHKSGESSAIIYYNSPSSAVRSLEFSSDDQESAQGTLPGLPDIGGSLNTTHHVSFAVDENGTSATWSERSNFYGSRCFTAHFDPDGDLISADILPGENSFSWIAANEDGSRTVLHGNGEAMFVTLMRPNGNLTDERVQINRDRDYVISHTGLPEFSIMLTGDRLELIRSFASGKDQASEIELTTHHIDVTPCRIGDFDCDGVVNGSDLARLLGFWGQQDADLDGDGITNGADLAILLGSWTD